MDRIRELHPCFGLKKNNGRIHLPVSPGCNIFCKFCSRDINRTEYRPGVTMKVITPPEALDIVSRALKLCPEITVVGIAGPGDTLATDYALDTFRLVGAAFPHLIKCMSTNGLLLPAKSDEIIDTGVETLTVTVNAVDPVILSQLCSGIVYNGKTYSGTKAAKILIQNQLEGIKQVSKAGITVKANTVLVPGINDLHIEEVAKAVKEAGAEMYNIIPLIPNHELSHCKKPSCIDMNRARTLAGNHIDIFRHCQRCRADAVGVPGQSDFADQIYLKRIDLQDTFSHG